MTDWNNKKEVLEAVSENGDVGFVSSLVASGLRYKNSHSSED